MFDFIQKKIVSSDQASDLNCMIAKFVFCCDFGESVSMASREPPGTSTESTKSQVWCKLMTLKSHKMWFSRAHPTDMTSDSTTYITPKRLRSKFVFAPIRSFACVIAQKKLIVVRARHAESLTKSLFMQTVYYPGLSQLAMVDGISIKQQLPRVRLQHVFGINIWTSRVDHQYSRFSRSKWNSICKIQIHKKNYMMSLLKVSRWKVHLELDYKVLISFNSSPQFCWSPPSSRLELYRPWLTLTSMELRCYLLPLSVDQHRS